MLYSSGNSTVNGMMSKGFTLIELSIVLVVVGLLVSAILFGNNIVRNAEITSTIAESQNYLNAIDTFKQTYTQFPGDLGNAYSFWADSCDSTDTNCNGNGNGSIENNNSSSDNEAYRAWQHLYLSEIIPTTYNGTGNIVLPSINVPNSQLGGASYTFARHDNQNFLQLGGASGTNNNSAILTSIEAQSIDIKIDDGNPTSGSVRGDTGNSSTDCVALDNYTNLSNENNICIVNFLIIN